MLNFKFEKSEAGKRVLYEMRLSQRGYISAGTYRSETEHVFVRILKSHCEEERGPDKTTYYPVNESEQIVFTWDRLHGGYYVSMSGPRAMSNTLEILKEIEYDVRPLET